MRARGPRLDAFEVALIVGFACVLTLTAARHYYAVSDEARAFRTAYGSARNSQYDEELFIRDFFGSRRGGVFLDVGAGDYQQYSNTYYLETALGWSGIAVDALEEYAQGYRDHRPRTRFFSFFVGDTSDQHALFWVREGEPVYSSVERDAAGEAATARRVPTITLDDLLERAGVAHIDFLSMDIELAEPRALAGFSIDRYRPALACVEAHLPTRDAILAYFARHGYVPAGRYLRADTRNLYFVRLSPAS